MVRRPAAGTILTDGKREYVVSAPDFDHGWNQQGLFAAFLRGKPVYLRLDDVGRRLIEKQAPCR
jgi:hypothetical protein